MTSDTDSTPADADAVVPERAGRRLYPALIALAIIVVLVDQGTKWWAEATLDEGKRVPLIGDLLGLQLVYNPGAAFSIGTEYTWVLAIIAGLAVIGLAIYGSRVQTRGMAFAIGLLLGGATTHLGDRLFRQPGFGRGHVVDFIDYGNWFIGNVADIALVGGAILVVALSLLSYRTANKTEAPAPAE